MLNFSQNRRFFGLCDFEIWQMTSKSSRTHILCNFKLCTLFCSHLWIQAGATVWKPSIWLKIIDFSARVTSKFDGWPGHNNKGNLLCQFKLCALFCSHWGIQNAVTVRKCPNWRKIFLTSVTLTFVLWPSPFAWTSLLSMIITPEHFDIFRFWNEERNIVKKCHRQMDRRTDGQTDRQKCS